MWKFSNHPIVSPKTRDYQFITIPQLTIPPRLTWKILFAHRMASVSDVITTVNSRRDSFVLGLVPDEKPPRPSCCHWELKYCNYFDWYHYSHFHWKTHFIVIFTGICTKQRSFLMSLYMMSVAVHLYSTTIFKMLFWHICNLKFAVGHIEILIKLIVQPNSVTRQSVHTH